MKKAMIVVLVGIMLAFVVSVSCIAHGTDKDIAEVTVRYHYEGMEDEKVKLKDFDFGKPATGENEVVKFTGWYYNGKPITKFPHKIKKDFTLDANWEYEITLKDEIFDDVKTDTYQTINNEELEPLEKPDSKHDFIGWYIDDHEITRIDKVYLNKVILAKWNIAKDPEIKPLYIKKVNVRYHYEGMDDKIMEPSDFNFGEPSIPESDVSFLGWYHKGRKITELPGEVCEGETEFTLDAHWEYEITLKDEIFDDVKTGTYQTINNKLLSRPDRDSIYEFLGWYIDDNMITKIDKVYLSKEIYAKWNNINVIKSVADLKNASLKKNYVLKTDLDLSGLKAPLFEFKGDLNGLGHKLSGFKYNLEKKSYGKEKNFGLFSVNKGRIHNLAIDDFLIKSEPFHDKFFTNVGLLCGTCNGGTIENITIGTVDITVHRQSSRTGYICGKAENANISDIKVNSGHMSGNGDMGAIVGAAFSSVIDKCDVKDFTNKYYAVGYSRSIGGIAGYTETTEIKNCSLRDSEFIFDDYDKNSITPETLEPALGDIVGNLLNGGSISGCINENITNHTYYDKLKKDYKYGGFLGINPKTANQQKNIRHYDGGKVGKK